MNKELALAYEILKKIYMEKSYVSIELNKQINTIENINKALVTKIVYGVLEKDITLEYFVSQFVSNLPKKEILILLKIVGFVSKSISSIPPFALVNEVVELVKQFDRHQAGFVNATSKKLISKDIILPPKSNFELYLSIKYSYPLWVIKELLKTKSKEFVEKLVSAELETLTHVRINLQKITSDEFRKMLKQKEIIFKDSLYDYTMYIDYAKILGTELMQYVVVQGLPSIITCNVLGAKSGKILDVCAAPGGKSIYLACSPDVQVYSCDIHGHRVDLIRAYAKVQNTQNIKFFVQDATKTKNEFVDKFDYVLCDVPCSNLGVSRKKPDVFLNKELSDVSTLSGLQYQILCNSAKYVKKGGVLLYSTCTILDKENKDVIDKFLKTNKDFELTPIDVGLELLNNHFTYTFYPHMTSTEGFFIGRLIRK